MSDDEVATKLRLLLHFRGSGKATDKEYQELSDVNFVSISMCSVFKLVVNF